MLQNNLLSVNILLYTLLIVIFSACQPEEKQEAMPKDAYVQDANDLQAEFDDLGELAVQALFQLQQTSWDSNDSQTLRNNAQLRGCSCTITHEENDKRLVIDFGAQGVLCADGRVRRGKLIVTYTAPYLMPGSIITIRTDNFAVSNRRAPGFWLIEGEQTITNLTEPGSNPTHRIMANGSITFTGGRTAAWSSSRMREWVRGYESLEQLLDPYDDEFHVTGGWEGTDRRGQNFTADILEALVVKTTCLREYALAVVEGVLKIEGPLATHTVDYGNGECDNTISITTTIRP